VTVCTNCGERLKPVVAIDIDGTLADYHGHFLQFSCDYLGINYPSQELFEYNGSIPFKVWWLQAFEQDERTWYDIKLAYRQGAQKRMQRPIDVSIQLVELNQDLKESGVEVWITTTRPYLSLDRVDPDTRYWLSRYGITYFGLLYDEDKYRVLAERINPSRVVAVLDDLPEMYDSAAQLFGDRAAILRSTKWNAAVDRPNVVGQLGQFMNEVRDRLIEWETQWASKSK